MKKKDCIALGHCLYAKYLKIWTACLNIKKNSKFKLIHYSMIKVVYWCEYAWWYVKYKQVLYTNNFFQRLSIIYRIIVCIITSYHIYKINTYMMM